jgi:hypothetical protein
MMDGGVVMTMNVTVMVVTTVMAMVVVPMMLNGCGRRRRRGLGGWSGRCRGHRRQRSRHDQHEGRADHGQKMSFHS